MGTNWAAVTCSFLLGWPENGTTKIAESTVFRFVSVCLCETGCGCAVSLLRVVFGLSSYDVRLTSFLTSFLSLILSVFLLTRRFDSLRAVVLFIRCVVSVLLAAATADSCLLDFRRGAEGQVRPHLMRALSVYCLMI